MEINWAEYSLVVKQLIVFMGVNFCRDPVPINPFHAHYFEE